MKYTDNQTTQVSSKTKHVNVSNAKWQNAFSVASFQDGITQWKFKISGCNSVIGIVPTDNIKENAGLV